MEIETRKAEIKDLKAICHFTDFWLAGRGKRVDAPGAVDDYFISQSQHLKYIEKYTTTIAVQNKAVIAWAVVQLDGTMIHFLIAGDYRGQGLGTKMLKKLNPPKIRSKSNQSSGNPTPFYESRGYHKIDSVKSQGSFKIDKIKPQRLKIIDVLEKIKTLIF